MKHLTPLLILTGLAAGCLDVPEGAADVGRPDVAADVGHDTGDDSSTAPDADASEPLASSCREILETQPDAQPGTFTIAGPDGSPIEVECDGGWARVADINVADDPSCPPEWAPSTQPVGCGRDESGDTMREVVFEVPYAYDEVRGRARGIQFRLTDAFNAGGDSATLADNYVDGLAILRGTDAPAEHVWTFAAGMAEDSDLYDNAECPCAAGRQPPEFVGDHFFCESGVTGPDSSGGWEEADPLWDESDCGAEDYDWFTRSMSAVSTAPLRARLLLDSVHGDEDVLVTELELWIR